MVQQDYGCTGCSYGGIGVSHNGSGAKTAILMPGVSDTPRDYVVIDSDKDYAALANGLPLKFSLPQSRSPTRLPWNFSCMDAESSGIHLIFFFSPQPSRAPVPKIPMPGPGVF